MSDVRQNPPGHDRLLGLTAVPALAIIGLLFGEASTPVPGIVVATSIFALVLWLVDAGNPVQVMFLVGYGTFLYFPAVLNSIEYGTSFELFYLSSVVAAFFLNFTKGLVHTQQERPSAAVCRLFVALSVLIVLGAFLKPDLVSPFFPLEIMLFAMSLGSQTRAANLRYLLCFLAAFASYSLVAWGGFGRTVIAGWILAAFLYYFYANDVRVSKIVFGLVPTAGTFLLTTRDLLSGKLASLETVLGDSAFGPYRLASTFIVHEQTWGLDLSGFFDQVIFTLLVFVPRDVWPTKPYGFGFEYTVRNLEEYLVAAGHSVAATFIGEHLYYLGYWGLLTAILMSFLVALFCRVMYRIKFLHGYGIALVVGSLPVLVWGGMTSFSARVALPLIVALIASPLVALAQGASDPDKQLAEVR